MANRRAPLANVPNAVNSPFRGVNAAPSGSAKRSRAQSGDKDLVLGQPPYKKQAIELLDNNSHNEENVDPRKRRSATVVGQDRQDEVFGGRRTQARPTGLQQKLVAAREVPAPIVPPTLDQQAQQRRERQQKANNDNLESIRQWQRHYRKQFPQFNFYFESAPEDARLRTAAQFRALGARECRFFSKEVTHVITTRAIPAEGQSHAAKTESKNESTQPKTIQPSALTQDQRRTTDLLDANLQRRSQHYFATGHQDVDIRRTQGHNIDILVRAQDMGVKIWALEKLQRVLKTMLETDTGEQGVAVETRDTTKASLKPSKDVDLEKLLRNEKVNGPADRDMTVAAQDMVQMKGCYIYIHDMDEKTKPVMARDYPKPAAREQGKWPQFRLTPVGRCPFIEDPAYTAKLQQREAANGNSKAQQELANQRKSRPDASQNTTTARPALAEGEPNLRRSPRKAVQQLSKPLDPPKIIPAKRQSSFESGGTGGHAHFYGSTQQSLRGLPRLIGGEPVASGLQQSNITSAIRSQVISSAAISSTAPGGGFGMRAGDSREVSALKRKVLERGTSGSYNNAAAVTTTSAHSIPSSYMNDMRAAINEPQDPPPRAAKRRAQETLLGVVHEGDEEENGDGERSKTVSNAADATNKRRKTSKSAQQQQKEKEQREAKAGYCENCRDKFEDFDEHVVSRKHRKFALEHENWKELDSLLAQLKRPHRLV